MSQTNSERPVCRVCAERVAAGLPPCECAYCQMGARCPWGHDYPRSCPSAAQR